MTKQQLLEAIRRIIKQELNEEMKTDIDTKNTFDIIKIDGTKIEGVKFFPNGEWYKDTKTGRQVGGKVPEGAKVMSTKITENAPAPSKPKETPGPAVAPGKPEEEPDEFTLNPEDPSTLPNVAPKARFKKATMSEVEMLSKIIKKYRTAKKNG